MKCYCQRQNWHLPDVVVTAARTCRLDEECRLRCRWLECVDTGWWYARDIAQLGGNWELAVCLPNIEICLRFQPLRTSALVPPSWELSYAHFPGAIIDLKRILALRFKASNLRGQCIHVTQITTGNSWIMHLHAVSVSLLDVVSGVVACVMTKVSVVNVAVPVVVCVMIEM